MSVSNFRWILIGLLWLSCLWINARSAAADDTTAGELAATIDDFVRQEWQSRSVQPAERCSDAEFIRRVTLDLAGRVPTPAEVDTFLADGRDNKRTLLVDLLLGSEDHAIHFADLFDTLLMGRGEPNQYQQRRSHGWRDYLENVFRSNRPWDDVAREILLARPSDAANRGAVWFLYERTNQHQQIAESVAPAFFGVRIECAQCHNHMMADEIKQAHYWGLVAFFNRGNNVQTSDGPRVAESAIGGFSEFADLSGDSSPNVLTFLDAPTIDEPRPNKDEKQVDADDLYQLASADGEPRVPKFSRRQQFVQQVLNDHPLLSRAMVNRLWAIMLGRGIVHPYDEMDSMHAPSHPELLDWLASDFVDHDHDMRRLIRGLALSEAYQLQSIQPAGVDDPASFAWYLERPLTAEQLARSIQLVARGTIDNNHPLVQRFRQQRTEVLPDQIVVGVDEALFLTNGAALEEFLVDSNGPDHLLHRLSKLDSDQQRIEQLFQTTLHRRPSPEEAAAVAEFLAQRSERPDETLRHVLWSLISSAEFQFNH